MTNTPHFMILFLREFHPNQCLGTVNDVGETFCSLTINCLGVFQSIILLKLSR